MSDINEMLLEFAGRFRLDGDLLRCIDCNRGIVASRMDEEFVHAPSCKSRTTGGRPWAELQGILAGPLVDMLQKLRAELAAVKAERDQLQRDQDGIMLFVDKWLEPEDETEHPVVRSEMARRIALEWGERLKAERDELRDVLLRNNFSRCDAMACNCNGWHERLTGNGYRARFAEIDEAVGEHDGTLLDAVKKIIAERDATEAALRAWCGKLHRGWRDAVFSEDIRREYCHDIANLKAAGLWREPTGGES